jgi:RNA polymerase sigma-70 factor (ECF subfamily)
LEDGPVTDAELIRAVQAGDAKALDVLYERHLPSVWRYAYSHLAGNLHAAEDVVSETFLALVRQVSRLDPGGGSVGGWLIGTARHKVLDLRRRAGRFIGGEAVERAADDRPTTEPEPAAALETDETRAGVRCVLDRLDDDQRLALEWKYVDGLSVREIAQRLGRTEKAAETVLYRARISFRSACDQSRPCGN